MDNIEKEQLRVFINAELELAKRITNEYMDIITRSIQVAVDEREIILLRLERLQLEIDLRNLQGIMQEKLAELQ